MIKDKDSRIATRGEGFGRVNLLVRCGGYYRVFSTERYSVRSQLRQLKRMNPFAFIEAVSYGDTSNELLSDDANRMLYELNFRWIEDPNRSIPLFFGGIPIDNSDDPAHYLMSYNYRTALILMNVRQFNTDGIIQRDPFSNTELAELPNGPDPDKVVKACSLGRSVFIPCSEIDADDAGDVLLRWKGKRMERTLDGETRKGYWITGSRLGHDRR